MRRDRARLYTMAAILAVGLLAQGVLPLVPERALERLSEPLFGWLASFTSTPKGTSSVTVIEADQRTIERLGWPIARRHYAALLERLSTHGRPWVLSYLWLQSLAGNPAEDEQLAASMRDYGRYIGTGLAVDPDGSLDDDDVDIVWDKAVVRGPSYTDKDWLSDVGLTLEEARPFAAAETRVGVPNRFGPEAVVYCMPAYLSDAARTGKFAFLGGVAWAAAALTGRPLQLSNGLIASIGETQPSGEPLRIGEKQCLTATKATTTAYLDQRGIERISLVDAISGIERDYTGHLIVLAAGMRPFRGPGRTSATDDGVVPEPYLAARFVDSIATDKSVRRDAAARGFDWFGWLPLVVAFSLAAALWRLRALPVVFAAAALPLIGLAFAATRLYVDHVYALPMRFLVASLVTAALMAVYLAVRELRWLTLERRFSERLRDGWVQSNSLAFLREHLTTTAAAVFPGVAADVILSGETEPEDAAPLIPSEASKSGRSADASQPTPAFEIEYTSSGDVLRTASKLRNSFSMLAVDIHVLLGGTRLGRVALSVYVAADDARFAARVVNSLGSEIRLHWGRIALHDQQVALAHQKAVLARELELGQTVQSLLLPAERFGRLGPWEYRIAFRPYGPMAGDWYQVIRFDEPNPEGFVGLVAIGDVVGKGTSAALITSSIAGEFARAERSPRAGAEGVRQLMHDIHVTVRRLFRGKQYTTLSLALLTETDVFLASHAAPRWMIVRSDRRVETIKTPPANPLGVHMETFKARLTQQAIGPGEFLVAHTDGVMETYESRAAFEFLLKAEATESGVLAGAVPTFDVVDAAATKAGANNVLPDDKTLLVITRH